MTATTRGQGQSVTFMVEGVPSPGGSKSAFRLKNSPRIVLVDAGGKKTKEWRGCVARAASVAMTGIGMPLTGCLSLVVVFLMPRPKAHLLSDGRIRATAPSWHSIRPDATKLLRSTEDAMTGIVYEDDSSIVEQRVSKRYISGSEKPGAVITINRLDPE